MQTVDHIVIGGGAMGLATAWQLAKYGREVLLLEQFELSNEYGSSHGATRIFRVSYRDPLYTNLALTGIELWRELEAETDSVLLEQIGQIDHGNDIAIADVKNALDRHNLRYELLTAKDSKKRWPGMEFDNKVLFSPDGGRVNTVKTQENLAIRISELGGKILTNTRVAEIQTEGEFAIVQTNNGDFKTKSLIVAAGGWVKTLVDKLIKLPEITIDAGQPAYYQPIKNLANESNWPSFIHHGNEKRVETNLAFSAYGLFTPGEGMKIGTWANTPPIDPDQRDFSINIELLERQNKYVQTWFPGLQIDTAVPTSCIFTNTPDEHFVLDRKGPITVCSPCSGHGYKFVPIIGKITADLAVGGDQKVSQWRLPK
jgi:sarcosine oxidase